MKELFPEIAEKPTIAALVGLKITKVITNSYDEIREIQTEDVVGELHTVTFNVVDASYVAVEVDGEEVCSIHVEV